MTSVSVSGMALATGSVHRTFPVVNRRLAPSRSERCTALISAAVIDALARFLLRFPGQNVDPELMFVAGLKSGVGLLELEIAPARGLHFIGEASLDCNLDDVFSNITATWCAGKLPRFAVELQPRRALQQLMLVLFLLPIHLVRRRVAVLKVADAAQGIKLVMVRLIDESLCDRS